jgi:hypothetical protein
VSRHKSSGARIAADTRECGSSHRGLLRPAGPRTTDLPPDRMWNAARWTRREVASIGVVTRPRLEANRGTIHLGHAAGRANPGLSQAAEAEATEGLVVDAVAGEAEPRQRGGMAVVVRVAAFAVVPEWVGVE